MSRVIAVIPARMGSSRFPGKPLASLLGRPMIEHVVRRVAMCDALDAVHVATCDDEIRDVVESFGGNVIMTSSAHERASDRVAEAAEQLQADVVVMVQGDEPMIVPEMLMAAVAPLRADPAVGCVNLARRITDVEEYQDANTIKIVTDRNDDALYFSRAPIPSLNPARLAQGRVLKQVCVISFRRDFLRDFARLRPTTLEQIEAIDMLRVIEHGRRVRIVETNIDTHAVDTPADLRRVERCMRHDPMLLRYDAPSRLLLQRA